MEHREQVVHFSALYVLPIGSNLQIGVAGGPSLFIVNRTFVDSVLYDETYPFDSATFSSTTTREVKENQAGFHVGADVSWYFTDNVGVGGGVRFSRATLKFPAAGTDETISADLGGVQVGAGLRIRLGGRKAPAAPPPARTPAEPDPTRIYATPDTPTGPTDETMAVTLVATPILRAAGRDADSVARLRAQHAAEGDASERCVAQSRVPASALRPQRGLHRDEERADHQAGVELTPKFQLPTPKSELLVPYG